MKSFHILPNLLCCQGEIGLTVTDWIKGFYILVAFKFFQLLFSPLQAKDRPGLRHLLQQLGQVFDPRPPALRAAGVLQRKDLQRRSGDRIS